MADFRAMQTGTPALGRGSAEQGQQSKAQAKGRFWGEGAPRENEKEHPFLEHLPEFYLRDPLLIRLVELLEQPYLELERVIDRLPQTLYLPEQTPEPLLDQLGRLVGLPNESHLFLPEQMRALIPAMHRIRRRKGTRGALADLLCVFLETICPEPVEPVIIEYEDWINARMPPEFVREYPQLYRGEWEFAVLFPPLLRLQDPQEQARLERLVRSYTPAPVVPCLIFLKPDAGLDGMDYLGINLYL